MLGSGALVVMAEGTDLLAAATNVLRFFRDESCGKCVPCRVGSSKAHRMLDRPARGPAAGPATWASQVAELGDRDAQDLDLRSGPGGAGPGAACERHEAGASTADGHGDTDPDAAVPRPGVLHHPDGRRDAGRVPPRRDAPARDGAPATTALRPGAGTRR